MASDKNLSQTLAYARAIYELAIESWQQDLSAVSQKLADSPETLTQLDDAAIPFADRQKTLDSVLPENISQQARNFFYTLLKEGDLSLLNGISSGLSNLAAKSGAKIEIVTITTALELTDAEKEQFRGKFTKFGENLQFQFKVDETIMGGVVAQIGDKILDGSVVTRLNAVRDKLMAG